MTTPSSSRVRPLFRVLAAIFALVAVPMFALGIQAPHPDWRFLLPLLFWIYVLGYAAAVGKAPFFFR
jgi:hypothetical protein